MANDVLVRHDHKSRLFMKLFEDKQSLLELYNAVNESEYTDPEALTVNTIDDVIYMGMRNDVSFLLENRMNLYEHQSTWNPNMPLRGLFYFSRVYQGYVAEKNLDIYSQARLRLPAPEYIVFYNGTRDMPDRMEVKLSDSFPRRKSGEYALECRATILNINVGHNKKLLESCRKLYEYSFLIAKIREFLSEGIRLAMAVDQAVEFCIGKGILAGFLKQHRAEVREMILTEYNEELHIRSEKALSYHEGLEEGKRQGKQSGIQQGEARINALYRCLVKDNRFDDLKRATEDTGFQKKLLAEYGIK